jgi:hypothetical protein
MAIPRRFRLPGEDVQVAIGLARNSAGFIRGLQRPTRPAGLNDEARRATLRGLEEGWMLDDCRATPDTRITPERDPMNE